MHICMFVQRAEINMRALPKLLFTLLFYNYLLFVCATHDGGRACTCDGQWTARGSQLSLSTTWVPGIQLKSSHCAASAFTH